MRAVVILLAMSTLYMIASNIYLSCKGRSKYSVILSATREASKHVREWTQLTSWYPRFVKIGGRGNCREQKDRPALQQLGYFPIEE